jgi:hypothetical protein
MRRELLAEMTLYEIGQEIADRIENGLIDGAGLEGIEVQQGKLQWFLTYIDRNA